MDSPSVPGVEVRPLERADLNWARGVLTTAWGSPLIVTLSGLRDASSLPGFVASIGGEPVGLATYEFDAPGDCELVTLNSLVPGRGIGTALVNAVAAAAATARCTRVWLTTTNDNLPALRFYQRHGWELVALHRDILNEWRRVKPGISERGIDDISIRLELELRPPVQQASMAATRESPI